MQKKICLVAVNARYTHSNAAVRYLKKYCANDSWNIHISEYSINTDSKNIAGDILSLNFDAVGFSVYIWNVLIIKKIISILKYYNYKGKIFLGGPETGYNAEKIFSDEPRVDFIIKGFGEEGLKFLLKSDFTHNEKIISVKNPRFDEIPFLYEDDDFSDLKNRYIYYETSRGCPFRCAYCLSSAEGHDPDLRSLEKVKFELKYIINHQPMIIKFVDRTFNYAAERCREIWKYLIENSDGKIKYHFEINPALLGDDDFIILKDVPNGIFRFEAGIQSLNKTTLKAINRFGDWPRIKENLLKLISSGNIHLHVDLIAGLPFEDIDSFAHGFNELYSTGSDHIQLGFLKLLPGTELRAKADEYGLVFDSNPPYEIKNSGSMSMSDIQVLKLIESMIDIYYNSKKFRLTIDNLLEFYSNPFMMFKRIGNFFSQNSIHINKKNSLEKIIFYIEENHAEQASYLRDCLRWDNLSRSKNLRLPAILQSKDGIRIKKNIWKIIRQNISDMNKIELIQNGYLFVPESVLFQTRILKGNDLAVFKNGDTEPVFFSLH